MQTQQEEKQKKESFKAVKKENVKYVIRYKAGERWKIMFKNGEPLQFDTAGEARKHIEKLKVVHPEITFKERKWIFKKNGIV